MHKQAALNTAKLVATALLSGLGVGVIVNYVPIEALMYIAGIIFVGFMIWVFYGIEKSRLESLEKINKMVDKTV